MSSSSETAHPLLCTSVAVVGGKNPPDLIAACLGALLPSPGVSVLSVWSNVWLLSSGLTQVGQGRQRAAVSSCSACMPSALALIRLMKVWVLTRLFVWHG